MLGFAQAKWCVVLRTLSRILFLVLVLTGHGQWAKRIFNLLALIEVGNGGAVVVETRVLTRRICLLVVATSSTTDASNAEPTSSFERLEPGAIAPCAHVHEVLIRIDFVRQARNTRELKAPHFSTRCATIDLFLDPSCCDHRLY